MVRIDMNDLQMNDVLISEYRLVDDVPTCLVPSPHIILLVPMTMMVEPHIMTTSLSGVCFK